MGRRSVVAGLVVGVGILIACLSRCQSIPEPSNTQGTRQSTRDELGNQVGHGQLREDLPFEAASLDEIPPARTPHGKPLTLEDVAGEYSFTVHLAGRGLVIGADGSSRNSFGSCLVSGESQGSVRVLDGRLSFEAHDVKGRPTGRTCLAVPVWWEGRLYILGPSGRSWPGGLLEFCNAVNWGEEPRPPNARHLADGLLMRTLPVREGAVAPRNSIPDIAAKWILTKPIEGTVLDVLPNRRASVNLGRKDGVFVGMRLRSGYGEVWPIEVRVVSVEDSTCVVASGSSPSDGYVRKGDLIRCSAAGAKALEGR